MKQPVPIDWQLTIEFAYPDGTQTRSFSVITANGVIEALMMLSHSINALTSNFETKPLYYRVLGIYADLQHGDPQLSGVLWSELEPVDTGQT